MLLKNDRSVKQFYRIRCPETIFILSQQYCCWCDKRLTYFKILNKGAFCFARIEIFKEKEREKLRIEKVLSEAKIRFLLLSISKYSFGINYFVLSLFIHICWQSFLPDIYFMWKFYLVFTTLCKCCARAENSEKKTKKNRISSDRRQFLKTEYTQEGRRLVTGSSFKVSFNCILTETYSIHIWSKKVRSDLSKIEYSTQHTHTHTQEWRTFDNSIFLFVFFFNFLSSRLFSFGSFI